MKCLLTTLVLVFTFFSQAQFTTGFTFTNCTQTTIANIGTGTWRNFPLPTPPSPPWQLGDFTGEPNNWFQQGFPDGSWSTAVNVLNAGTMNMAWVNETGGEVHGALFRHDFNLTSLDGSFWFVALPNNHCEVYINGANLGGIIELTGGAKKICIPNHLLNIGNNTVAIKAGEYLDDNTTLQFGIYNNMVLTASTGNACIGNNGWIDLTVSDSCGAISYSWAGTNFGSVPTTEDISGLSQGLYTVTVEDAQGCTSEETFQILGQPDPISIPMDPVDCESPWQIQLPGYNLANYSFAAQAPLNTSSVTSNGLFDPSLAGPGNWIIEQTIVSGNGCIVTNHIHIEVIPSALPIAIPLGIVDCNMAPLALPRSSDPNITFSPGPGLNSNAINANNEFVPGMAGPGNWIVEQHVGSGPCMVTNHIHITVPEYEDLIEIDLNYFCANSGVDYFSIPGGGTFEVIQDPSGGAPYPIASGVISAANGFGLGNWQVKQSKITAGGCIIETIYHFEIVGNCTCFPEINLSFTENPDDCKVYDFSGSINYNGTTISHWRWSIFDQSNYQIIYESSNTSPVLNSSHDLSQLPIQVSGPQTVCFELWTEIPNQSGVLSYCKECFEIDLCPPPAQPENVTNNNTQSQQSNSNFEKLTIYPNPNNGRFLVESEEEMTHITVYDSKGKQVYDSNQMSSYQHELDLSNLDKGIYIIVTNGQNESHIKTSKLVIK